MSDLQDMLRVQARLHRKQGANALGQPFESAIEEIQLLNKTYNQLFDAFQDCQGELAKANERVKELDQENKEFAMLIANLVRRADVKIDLLQNPTYEKASEQLNKFAIEKKIEGVNNFCATLQGYEDVQPIGANYVTSVASHRDSFTEKLRKVQDSD